VVDVLEQERLIVTSPWVPADVPGRCWTEFTVGPATMEWTVAEVADRIAAVASGGSARVADRHDAAADTDRAADTDPAADTAVGA
jgi:hypothetical protein